ncbi:hypothetical protein BDQ17DRAFT_1305864 [Cyathus striatus]|nr:hypothetical protein BDQ17DRAFT_1305864 [Cyathus striatus]
MLCTSDLVQVWKYIDALIAGATKLDTAVSAFPAAGGSLANALVSYVHLVESFNPIGQRISETEGQTLLTNVEKLTPIFKDFFNQLILKKPTIQSIPLGNAQSLIREGLINLNTSSNVFENALKSALPVDLGPAVDSVFESKAADYATVISAYND